MVSNQEQVVMLRVGYTLWCCGSIHLGLWLFVYTYYRTRWNGTLPDQFSLTQNNMPFRTFDHNPDNTTSTNCAVSYINGYDYWSPVLWMTSALFMWDQGAKVAFWPLICFKPLLKCPQEYSTMGDKRKKQKHTVIRILLSAKP